MVRKLAVSNWAVGIAGLIVAAAHAWWLSWGEHAGEILSGLGAAFQALGLLVAARPFIRAGVRGTAEQQVQAPQTSYYDDSSFSITRGLQDAHRRKVVAALPDIWAERVVAVSVIGLGTLLNGYGAPIARMFGMRI